MLEVYLGDGKHEVWVGVPSGFLFRTELNTYTAQFLPFQVFNQVFRGLQHVFLKQLVYEWLVIRFRPALDHDTLEEFVDVTHEFLVPCVEVDEDGFVGDDLEELGELLLALLVSEHHLEAFLELDR